MSAGCGYGGAVGDEWKRFDWSKLTSVAPFCKAEMRLLFCSCAVAAVANLRSISGPWGREGNSWGLVCAAHEHGVRVVNWYKETDEIETCKGLDVLNSTAVDAWVQETVNQTLTMGQVSSIH